MANTIKKIVIMIDGGYLRAISNKAGKKYDPDFIEKFAHCCQSPDEEIFRILYYDCAPFNGEAKQPVSGAMHTFHGSDQWLNDLSKRELFAVRKGVLKFRVFKPAHRLMVRSFL